MSEESDTVTVNPVVESKKSVMSSEQKKIIQQRIRFRNSVLNVLFSIVFSCALGLFFIHTSMLWHQYQYGYGLWSGRLNSDVLPSVQQNLLSFVHHKSDIYEWSGGQLKVNTSIYVW